MTVGADRASPHTVTMASQRQQEFATHPIPEAQFAVGCPGENSVPL